MSRIAEAPVSTCRADHAWSLRDVDFEDGGADGVRRFECVSCGAVRFE